jgi:hypothetical protein
MAKGNTPICRSNTGLGRTQAEMCVSHSLGLDLPIKLQFERTQTRIIMLALSCVVVSN